MKIEGTPLEIASFLKVLFYKNEHNCNKKKTMLKAIDNLPIDDLPNKIRVTKLEKNNGQS